jgi:3-methyl-2-oxobutanoate hydroxymethyltransferase
VEAVPPKVCGIIRDKLATPVYSIGAGWEADGQFMICSDVLGIFQDFTPRFVKKYENLRRRPLKLSDSMLRRPAAANFRKKNTHTK